MASRDARKSLQRLLQGQFLLMLVAFVGIVFAFGWLLRQQMAKQQAFYQQELEGDFKERVDMLNRLLGRVEFVVQSLKCNVEELLDRSRFPERKFYVEPLFSCLQDNPGAGFFSLNSSCLLTSGKALGSLTGKGSVRGRSIDFYRELNMALGLAPCFQRVKENVHEVTWVYYTSARGFIYIYPWIDPGEFHYDDVLLTHDFFKSGLPESNPEKKLFWTRIYRDEAGKGLMTTCAVPVYDHNRFTGTVAVDLTVNHFNSLLKDFRWGRGQLFVVNNYGQLVAHSGFEASRAAIVSDWKTILPENLQPRSVVFTSSKQSGPVRIGDYLGLWTGLGSIPWTVYYFEPYPVLGGAIFQTLGIGAFVLVCFAFFLAVICYLATYRWFVAPSREFVSYVLSQGRQDEEAILRRLPGIWKGWFSDLAGLFAERRALEEQLQEQNMRLEEKVQERTRSLEQEIEERKRIAQELKRSEEKFFKAFHCSPIIAAITSFQEGRYVEVNDLFLSITGYSREEIIGETVFGVHFFEDSNMHQVIREQMQEKGKVDPVETRYLTKYGEIRDCIYSAEIIEIANKKHILSTGFDVTYLKRTELALKESEAKFRSLAETCPIGIAIVHGLNIVYVNKMFEKMTGFSRAELLTMNILELVKPSDREVIVAHGRKRVQGVKEVFRYELKFFTKQGQEGWCEVVTSQTNMGDQERAIVSVLDITERKKAEGILRNSEAQYRAIFETAGAGLYLFDQQLLVTRVNSSLALILGRSRQEIEGQMLLSEFFVPEEQDRIVDLSRQVLQGQAVKDFQFRMQTKNGEQRHVLLKADRLPGSGLGIASVLDYTGLIKAEKEKEILKESLLHSQKMESLGVLTSGIAHEFNNILQGLFASVEMIVQEEDLPPEVLENVQRIEKVGSRAKSLVHGLLDFSRKSRFEFMVLDLNEVVCSALEIFRPALPKLIRIDLELEPNLPAMFGDAKRLEQVVINLLSNARDAVLSVQKGKILVATEYLDEGRAREKGLQKGQFLSLIVQDNGQGLTPETRQKIFDPFYSTKDIGKGTGLGLSMVYGIVKEHEGVIECHSTPGEGSRFEICFPVQEGAAKEKDVVQVTPEQKIGSVPDSHVVLLVDDEQMVRDVVKEGLQDTGFQVLVAEDGEMALEVYKEHGNLIDLVILDLGMPKMGGEQCLEQIKKINQDAKVLVSSGYINHEMTRHPEQFGIVGFLKKPYRFSEIIEKIREVLR